jgi:hypothetical protein
MRLLLLLPILLACQSTPVPVVPPSVVEVPVPKDLIKLETNPKPDVFVVTRGTSKVLTVTGKMLSPAAEKIKVSISGSSGVEISPKEFTLTNNAKTDFTVTVPQNATNDKPYFYVNGQALDGNNKTVVSNGVTIKFQWDVLAPIVP